MPSTLTRAISPPPRLLKRQRTSEATVPSEKQDDVVDAPSLAAIEAGKAKIDAHLAYFQDRLSKVCRDVAASPRMSISDWARLYEANEHEHGNHFVVHQHNHPVSGVHYDLRLQFSKSSSLSFAVPKGLPGNPNSKSLGRMAIETRVHNLWNHLIESASAKTGSLLIWDTGTYTILPRKSSSNRLPSPQTTDDESNSDFESPDSARSYARKPENEKLIEAFKLRHMRIRLNGTRLPEDYTFTLRLPSAQSFPRSNRGHRRRGKRLKSVSAPQSTDTEAEDDANGPKFVASDDQERDVDTDEDEDAQTRLNNAYPGSTNSIGSVHQRKWFMLLDAESSGFTPEREAEKRVGKRAGKWTGGFEPFFVLGKDHERSVVTGRLAAEVESDEGVEDYVGRGGWVGITR